MVLKFMAELQWHHSKKSRHNKIEHCKSYTTNTTLHRQRSCTKIYKSFYFMIFINLVLQNLYTNRDTTSYQTFLINYSLNTVTSSPITPSKNCKLHVEFPRNNDGQLKTKYQGTIIWNDIPENFKNIKTVKMFS